MFHSDLTDTVKIELRSLVKGIKDASAFPLAIAELGSQQPLLRRKLMRCVDVIGENKEKQGFVITERYTSNHASRFIVHHVDIFIARPITAGLECSNYIA